MNANDIVNALADLGATLHLTSGEGPGPTITVDAPSGAIDEQLANLIRSNRTMIINVLLGRSTGHVLSACTQCGLETMVNASRPVRKCRMTPGCQGRHEIPKRHQVDSVKPPHEAPLPDRPAKSRLLGPRPQWKTP